MRGTRRLAAGVLALLALWALVSSLGSGDMATAVVMEPAAAPAPLPEPSVQPKPLAKDDALGPAPTPAPPAGSASEAPESPGYGVEEEATDVVHVSSRVSFNPEGPADCELLDTRFQRLADRLSEATKDCELVLYTTVFFPGDFLLADPDPKAGPVDPEVPMKCRLLVAGRESAKQLRARRPQRWTVFDTDMSTVARNGRYLSKPMKLAPHLYFRHSRYTVFVDWKMDILRSPSTVLKRMALQYGAGLSLMQHPCVSALPDKSRQAKLLCGSADPEQWLFTEIDKIIAKGKTSVPGVLRAQKQRYREMYDQQGFDFTRFSDTALIVADLHAPLTREASCRWLSEYESVLSGDRDQPAFAYAMGSMSPSAFEPATGGFIKLVDEGNAPRCDLMCHWYNSDDPRYIKERFMLHLGNKDMRRSDPGYPKGAKDRKRLGVEPRPPVPQGSWEPWREQSARFDDASCKNHPNMQKALVAITTCNHWDKTERLLQGLLANDEASFYDPVLFDDASADGTQERARAMGVRVESNVHAEGVTYTWNQAYRVFKHECYGYYFNVNNDIIIPRGAVPNMMRELALHSEIGLLGPMTSTRGVGQLSLEACADQPVEVQFPELQALVDRLPESTQELQDAVAARKQDVIATRVLGFFMAGARHIIRQELAPDSFWDPFKINLGQETSYLRARQGNFYLSRSAFVFHDKGSTLTSDIRNAGKTRDLKDPLAVNKAIAAAAAAAAPPS